MFNFKATLGNLSWLRVFFREGELLEVDYIVKVVELCY